jgi:hypothetical protein
VQYFLCQSGDISVCSLGGTRPFSLSLYVYWAIYWIYKYSTHDYTLRQLLVGIRCIGIALVISRNKSSRGVFADIPRLIACQSRRRRREHACLLASTPPTTLQERLQHVLHTHVWKRLTEFTGCAVRCGCGWLACSRWANRSFKHQAGR